MGLDDDSLVLQLLFQKYLIHVVLHVFPMPLAFYM